MHAKLKITKKKPTRNNKNEISNQPHPLNLALHIRPKNVTVMMQEAQELTYCVEYCTFSPFEHRKVPLNCFCLWHVKWKKVE